MTPASVFAGAPVPQPPRIYVHGVDRPRESDRPAMLAFDRQITFVLALCALPNTPFTRRFAYRQAD